MAVLLLLISPSELLSTALPLLFSQENIPIHPLFPLLASFLYLRSLSSCPIFFLPYLCLPVSTDVPWLPWRTSFAKGLSPDTGSGSPETKDLSKSVAHFLTVLHPGYVRYQVLHPRLKTASNHYRNNVTSSCSCRSSTGAGNPTAPLSVPIVPARCCREAMAPQCTVPLGCTRKTTCLLSRYTESVK